MSTTAPARRLRADAARNLALVVEAARRLFAERGLEVTLHDVAEAAGVGVGTVYRRFEDKEALLGALVEAKFDSLVELAESCAALPTGREALRGYLLGAMELRASDKSLSTDVMRAAPYTERAVQRRADLAVLIAALVERAHAEGALREGFAPEDVPAVTSMVGSIADRTRTVAPGAWRRYGVLLADSVCPLEAGLAPMTGEPLELPVPGCEVASSS